MVHRKTVRLACLMAGVMLLAAGCGSHNHALLITSTPSAQRLTVHAVDTGGTAVPAFNDITGPTPYEVVFPGRVHSARVTVSFENGEQIKEVSFRHVHKTSTVVSEPILGFPLLSIGSVRVVPKAVHFDQARRKDSATGMAPKKGR